MKKDMTEGREWSSILLFSLPIMGANLLQVLYNLADSVIVGNLISATALGAVGLTSSMIWLLTAICTSIGAGVNIAVAQYFGAKKETDIQESISVSYLIAVVVSIFLLGGYGLFGVELFVCGDEVIFSEVSPRPHDTGMVTLISQDLSEFALHVRAFLGLPVGAIRQYGPAASAVILPQLSSQNVSFGQLQSAVGAGLQLRLFGKPEIDGTRRLGVTLAVADSVEEAVARAKTAAAAVIVEG